MKINNIQLTSAQARIMAYILELQIASEEELLVLTNTAIKDIRKVAVNLMRHKFIAQTGSKEKGYTYINITGLEL
jgi:predicted HTH transcriptional regulator